MKLNGHYERQPLCRKKELTAAAETLPVWTPHARNTQQIQRGSRQTGRNGLEHSLLFNSVVFVGLYLKMLTLQYNVINMTTVLL